MNSHFFGKPAASSSRGSSLAVRQFVDLAFGWVPVHKPTTPFRVEAVEVDERYCLQCCDLRNFDVVHGFQVSGAKCQAAFCRSCGAEFGGENG